MNKNKNKQSKFFQMLIVLSVAVFMFTATARPAYAILGVGDISFTNVITDIPGKLLDIFNKIRAGAGSRAYHQALRSVTYKLAQDTAVWVASGGKGKKPLLFKDPGKALEEMGDQVAGKFLVNMSAGTPLNLCSPANVNSRLKLTIGVSKSIQDFDIFPENDINRDTGKTGCSFSDIKDNVEKTRENMGKALDDFSKGFDIDKNPLGSFVVLREHVAKEKKREEDAEKLRQTSTSEEKGVQDPVTKKIKTTKWDVMQAKAIAASKALGNEAKITGDIFVDAFQIFANTLAQTYLTRLQQGLYNYRPGRSPGGLFSGIEGSPASKAALLAEYDAFSPQKALNLGTPGEVDLFADMSACPENQYQTPYNCLLSDNLQQAVQQELTVAQAVESGLIDQNMMFPQKHKDDEPRLSKENLKKLRFLRVIPLGWEIAAERLGSDRIRFSELIECFNDETTKKCAGLHHLVDPKWILDLPQQFCKAQGYGTIAEHEKSPNRSQLCVDLQSCIKEDSSGRCEGYGYCTRERNTWQLSGRSCDPQFATCRTFTSPDNSKMSILTNSINAEGCDKRGASGCKWYSTDNTSGSWNESKKIYLNSNAQSCSSADENTREVIILDKGVNIIKNGEFAELYMEQGNNAPADEGGWIFTNLGDGTNGEYSGSEQAVKPEGDANDSGVWQEVDLKPYTYYTLSFDIRGFEGSNSAIVEVRKQTGTLYNISFPLDNYSYKQIEHSWPRIEVFSNSETRRYAATFFSGPGENTVKIRVHLKNQATYDNIQLEEIKIDLARDAKDYVARFDSGSSKENKLKNLNFVETKFYNRASPSTSFVSYNDNRRVAFRNAEECSAIETSARKYTLATDPDDIKFARLEAGGLCLAQCDGMDNFLEMPTLIEEMKDGDDTVIYPESKIFIPEYAQQCTDDEVGCEEFTNTRTEQREYFNNVQSCVLDTNTDNISTFFTWEDGDTPGFQLKAWQLLKDNVQEGSKGFGPCTNFPQGSFGSDASVTPKSAVCGGTSSSKICSQNDSDVNYSKTCRVFLDEGGKEYYRDSEKIVTASSECTTYRRTVAVDEVQEDWYFIPEQADRCSASAVGCREYKGTRANQLVTLMTDDFKNDVENWSGGTLNNSAIITGGKSYRITSGATAIKLSDDLKEKEGYENYDLTEKTFRIKFLARSDGGTGKISKVLFGGEEFPTKKGDGSVDLTENWAPYELGPLLNREEAPDLSITAIGGTVDIDKIVLEEVDEFYYLIKSSILRSLSGGSQPNMCFSGNSPLFNKCRAYNDDKSNTYYVEDFAGLFKEDAIKCTAVIDTQNFSNPYSREFQNGYEIGADKLEYRKLISNADLSSAGCKELGFKNDDGSWRSIYKKVDPDDFGEIMCMEKSVGCETFTTGSGSNYVFRDPEGRLCSWNADKGKFTVKIGTQEVDCNFNSSNVIEINNENYALSCATDTSGNSTQDSCTAYLPKDEQLSEGATTALFSLADTVSAGDCSSHDIDVGCVEFYVNYINPPSIRASKLSSDAQKTSYLQVDQKRECAEWLSPTTVSDVDDPRTRTKRTVVYDFGRCQALGSNGGCVAWVDPADGNKYPKAYQDGDISAEFDEARYQERYTIEKDGGSETATIFSGAWDYSGYSIRGQYPLETLAQKEIGTSGVFQLENPAGDDVREVMCRSFPEEDSPFSRGSVAERIDDSGRPYYNKEVTFSSSNSNLKPLSLCEKQADNGNINSNPCECSYKKVESLNETIWLPSVSQRILPDEVRSIVNYEGWYGYCVEEDEDSKDPNGNNSCLVWWPVDVVQGKNNIFNNNPEAGFQTNQPLYYCLAAEGNKLNDSGFGLEVKNDDIKDNNYLLKVPYHADTDYSDDMKFSGYKGDGRRTFPNIPTTMHKDGFDYNGVMREEDDLGDKNLFISHDVNHVNISIPQIVTNGKYRVHIRPFVHAGYAKQDEDRLYNLNPDRTGGVDYSVDDNGWIAASGILPFPINNNSPIARLHEYDIEKVILKPIYPKGIKQYNDWPKSSDSLILQREGSAIQNTGGSSISINISKDDKWTILWCNGKGCDFGGLPQYSWSKFSEYIEDERGLVEGDSWTEEDKFAGKNLFCHTLKDTNLLAMKAVFADENGLAPKDYKSRVDYFKNREPSGHGYSPTISFSGYEEQDWNNLEPYQFLGFEGGLCDGSSGEGWAPFDIYIQLREWCTDVVKVTSEQGENKAWAGRIQGNGAASFNLNDDQSPAGVEYNIDAGNNKGAFVNLYRKLDDSGFTPFNFSQDNSPFGVIVPPVQTIYNPEDWDSRMGPDDAEAADLTDEEKMALEGGKQPLYVEKASKQVRAGSPYSCNEEKGAQSCVIPPDKGSPQTSVDEIGAIGDDARSKRTALSYLKQLFVEIYGWWKWDKTESVYDEQSVGAVVGKDISAGECPIILSAYQDPSTGKLRPPEGFDLSASFDKDLEIPSDDSFERGDYFNAPNTGNCPATGISSDTNYGRYAVNGISIIPASNVVDAYVGDEVALQFYALNYNGEQLPIKKIEIDWDGEGDFETVIQGNFKNHRYDCSRNAQNYGQTDKACDKEPLEFRHIYGKSGTYSPRIKVTDNWGISTIAQYPGKGVISILYEDINLDARVYFKDLYPANKGEDFVFDWWVEGTEAISSYKIRVKRKLNTGNFEQDIIEVRTSKIYTVTGSSNLSLVTIAVQPCTQEGACGSVARKTIAYPPDPMGDIVANPATPEAGKNVVFSWNPISEAEFYNFTIDSGEAEKIYGTSKTIQYTAGTESISAEVKACNYIKEDESRCGNSNSAAVQYSPPVPLDFAVDDSTPEYGDVVIFEWSRSAIADEYKVQLDKTVDGIVVPTTEDTTETDMDVAYEIGMTAISAKVQACKGAVCSGFTGTISIIYTPKCGNGEKDKGEDCDPKMSAIEDYSVEGVSGGNSVTKRCVPYGETKTAGAVTRTACQWWPDEDNDGHDGKDDCQNHIRESNMFIGSSYKHGNKVDYNCDGTISDKTITSCGSKAYSDVWTNWGSDCETPCSSSAWCITSYPSRESACSSGAGSGYEPFSCSGEYQSGGPPGASNKWRVVCEKCVNPTTSTIYW